MIDQTMPMKRFAVPAFIHATALYLTYFLHRLLWNIPFICQDDLFTSVSRFRFGGLWESSKIQAAGQSRFFQLLYFTLTQLTYLTDGYHLHVVARIFGSVLGFLAFWGIVSEISDRVTASVALIFLGSLMEATSGFNSFQAQPLWFNFDWALCLVGFYFYLLYLKRPKQILWIAFLTFWTLGMLGYESLPICGIFLAVSWLWIRQRPLKTLWSSLEFYKEHRSLIVINVIYVIAYVAYKKMTASGYSGTKPSLGSFQDTFRTIWIFSWSGLFLKILHRDEYVSALSSWQGRLQALAIALSLYWGLIRARLPLKWWHLVIIFMGSFIPNLLYGFVDRYREWVKQTPIYLGTYYSAFFLALWLMGSILLLISSLPIRFKKPAAIVFSFFFALQGVLVLAHNQQFFTENFTDQHLYWDDVNADLKSGLLKNLKENDRVFSHSLNNIKYVTPKVYQYWDFYFLGHWGHPVTFVDVDPESTQATYEVLVQPGMPSVSALYLPGRGAPSLTLLNHSGWPISILLNGAKLELAAHQLITREEANRPTISLVRDGYN